MQITEESMYLLQEKPEVAQRILAAKQAGGTSLDLSNLGLTREDLELIEPIIRRQLPNLKELKLSGSNIDNESLRKIALSLGSLGITVTDAPTIPYEKIKNIIKSPVIPNEKIKEFINILKSEISAEDTNEINNPKKEILSSLIDPLDKKYFESSMTTAMKGGRSTGNTEMSKLRAAAERLKHQRQRNKMKPFF